MPFDYSSSSPRPRSNSTSDRARLALTPSTSANSSFSDTACRTGQSLHDFLVTCSIPCSMGEARERGKSIHSRSGNGFLNDSFKNLARSALGPHSSGEAAHQTGQMQRTTRLQQ